MGFTFRFDEVWCVVWGGRSISLLLYLPGFRVFLHSVLGLITFYIPYYVPCCIVGCDFLFPTVYRAYYELVLGP